MTSSDPLLGCLIGTAIGDALGLPCEGLPPDKQRRRFKEITGHRLFFGRGLYSDDTEHTIMVAQALIASNGDVQLFQTALARQLRLWILLLPGGVGLATLKAGWKLVCGVSPQRSGVFSAGNGPAMRAAIMGVFAARRGLSLEQLKELNCVSTQITHTDPKAEYGALAIAIAAFYAVSTETIKASDFCSVLTEHLPPTDKAAQELLILVDNSRESRESGQSTAQFCASQGWKKGASGYIYHTVSAALHAWMSHPENYRDGVLEIIRCGGDTDSTAAIVGGLIGARVDTSSIPQVWQDGLCEWPRSIAWMEKLAERLSEVCEAQAPRKMVPTFWSGVLARNIFFLIVVLCHALRRLLPF